MSTSIDDTHFCVGLDCFQSKTEVPATRRLRGVANAASIDEFGLLIFFGGSDGEMECEDSGTGWSALGDSSDTTESPRVPSRSEAISGPSMVRDTLTVPTL